MALGFWRHMYKYFAPDEEEDRRPQKKIKLPTQASGPDPLQIVMYDQEGNFIGYARYQTSGTEINPLPKKEENDVPIPETLYRQMPDGKFEAVTKSLTPPSYVKNLPKMDSKPIVSAPKLPPMSPKLDDFMPPEGWNGWPDGSFECFVTKNEYKVHGNLKVHWAHRANGGDKTGRTDSPTWQQGKRSTRQCLGVLVCDNLDCAIIVRPNVREASIAKQLLVGCPSCGASLSRVHCPNRSKIWVYSDGVYYDNGLPHSHGRLRPLGLLPTEQQQFEAIVAANPKAGPLQLITGVPTINGPGDSVADISDCLINADQVNKEKQKIVRRTGMGGDSFITAFSEFCRKNPGFVIFSQIAEVTVISLQSPFMASQIVKDSIMDGPVNGLVTDATHSYFADSSAKLVISSVYSPDLCCWVPGIFSYVNGETACHYELHFLALFQSIAHEAHRRGIEVVDETFIGVLDFSDAERTGFIAAFIAFWGQRGDTRSAETLTEIAESLLRGCEQHFRASITRLKKIHGVVGVGQEAAFEARAVALLDAGDHLEFIRRANVLMRDFPKVKNWLTWWMRPAHAKMLFSSERTMSEQVWTSLPSTTNAEEAMHWKLYCAVGRNHALLEGLVSLLRVAEYYKRLHDAVQRGIPIAYKPVEPWKATAAHIGRTKPSRAPNAQSVHRKKNDGRPPDTKKELLKPSRGKARHQIDATVDAAINKRPLDQITRAIASYPWSLNSCWIDTSLELLFQCISRDFKDYASGCQDIPKLCGLNSLYGIMDKRRVSELTPHSDDSQARQKERDTFRKLLKTKGAIRAINQPESLLVWIGHLSKHEKPELAKKTYRSQAYFETLFIEVHECTGDSSTQGRHVEILGLPLRQGPLIVTSLDYQASRGDLDIWFSRFISVLRDPIKATKCWRTQEDTVLCSGERTDMRNIVASIPVILAVELENFDGYATMTAWDVPSILYPDTIESAESHGLVYNLVGRAMYREADSHFTCQHFSKDYTKLYDYDGMLLNGFSSVKNTVFAPGEDIPQDFCVSAVFYHLQGGWNAQQHFYSMRHSLCDTQYNVTFSDPTLQTLPSMSYNDPKLKKLDADKRYWMINPYNSRTIEYISKPQARPWIDTDLPDSNSSVVFVESEDEILGQTAHSNRPPSPNISEPDSLFNMDCRCGVTGDGNLLYDHKTHGAAIQCDQCHNWLHIACQREGRAGKLGEKDAFVCDQCDKRYSMPQHSKKLTKLQSKREMENHTLSNKPLTDRLWAGRGALARHGDYYYPVRLVEKQDDGKWAVHWWRENVYATEAPNQVSCISELDLVDSLWMDRHGRRQVRLGKWKHGHLVEKVEDILVDPSLTPYTKNTGDILSPHLTLLESIMQAALSDSCNDIKDFAIPSRDYLIQTKKPIFRTTLPYHGSISVMERAEIMNWCYRHLGIKDNQRRHHVWFGKLPYAHTMTLYISGLLKSTPGYQDLGENEQLEKAWEAQYTEYPSWYYDVDVDAECIGRLEDEMFEISERAGIAGNHQWGLDAGDHQYWYPYCEKWHTGEREENDEETELGPDYVKLPPLPVPKEKPRPKPRLKNSKGQKA